MWPLFGLVTLVVACVFAGRQRFRARWVGIPATCDPYVFGRRKDRESGNAIPYRYSVHRRKNGPATTKLGVDTATTLDFECKPETWIDRFFKWTGLTVEQQLGVGEFDRAIYLVSDDPRVLQALGDDPRIAEILTAFFARRPHPDYRALRLVCRSGTLRLDLREASQLPARGPQMESEVLPLLQELAGRLPIRLLREDKARDRIALRTVLVLALSTGLAINGAFHLFRLLMFSGATTLEPGALLAWTLPAGGVLFAVLVLATLVLLARSSRLHLVMLEVMVVGLFGAFATAFTKVRDANMALDQSAATTMEVKVADKFTRKSRRSRRRYYLVMSDWPVAGDAKVRVDGQTYDRFQVGDPAVLHLRQGWLDVAWLERVEKGAAGQAGGEGPP